MRRRAIVGFMAVLAASALVVGMSMTVAGAKAKPTPYCAGKTKAAAIKAIKLAYEHFLNGAKYPDAVADKEPYIDHLSGKNKNAELVAQFEASAAQNAAAAATTAVDVDKVKCANKKGTKADVTFTLVIGGNRTEGLAPPGTAVLIGKTWKVGADTLCNTQALGDPSVLESGPCYDIITAP